MPITITYDLQNADGNTRSYVRSMMERFGWKRMGGSVFRYPSDPSEANEDWLNDVVPALMFLRSYAVSKGITLQRFTVDAASTAYIDHSDPELLLGLQPLPSAQVAQRDPANHQSSVATIQKSVQAAIDAI